MQVAIIGNGILANLGALYFKKHLPESVDVVLIGPDDRGGLPLVGESTIEITAEFLEGKLGLGEYLCENQYPKFGLTYYFKLDPDNPEDRTYSVHCNERGPNNARPLASWKGPMVRPLSWLLNRFTFDRDIMKMVADHGGIERIRGRVTDVDLDGEKGHTLHIKETDGHTRSLKADWIIDGTGRNRLLAKKLGLIIKPEGQRDCFWFWLADFDRDLLKNLNALGPKPPALGEPFHYDRYYTTHHFMGRGNWIWMIPLKSEDGSELISIGFVSHPGVYEGEVGSVEDFMEQVGKVHPVVTDFVKSGRVVDSSRLRRYHYVVSKVYSPDRWGIVGDAAFAPDPLFSNGLAFGTLQLEQLAEMIAQDCKGNHKPKYVDSLSSALMAPVIASQTAISNWYYSMHDPFLSALRLTWIEFTYFYLLLPLAVNRCHYQFDRMKLWRALQLRQNKNPFEIPQALLNARGLFDKPTPEHFIYKGKEKVNPRALDRVDNIADIMDQIKDGSSLRTQYTREVVARAEALAD
jgi:2-polyprenyl-6-methoxyphenol hydroxylase-like FAD-dependent oxidoreductase